MLHSMTSLPSAYPDRHKRLSPSQMHVWLIADKLNGGGVWLIADAPGGAYVRTYVRRHSAADQLLRYLQAVDGIGPFGDVLQLQVFA